MTLRGPLMTVTVVVHAHIIRRWVTKIPPETTLTISVGVPDSLANIRLFIRKGKGLDTQGQGTEKGPGLGVRR